MARFEMLESMKRLDAHTNALLLTGASDIDLLAGMFDVMPDFKALLDAGYGSEIETHAERFPRLYRYRIILSNVAVWIADGSIRAPRYRPEWESKFGNAVVGVESCRSMSF